LKIKTQPVLDLFKIITVPVPYNTDQVSRETDGKYVGAYTWLKPTNRYLGMGKAAYLNFDQDKLDACKLLGEIYYCENLFIMRHISDHTCESAIFFNQTEKVMELCDFQYMPSYTPPPTILDAGEYLLFAGLELPWTVYCQRDLQMPVELEGGPYVLIKRSDICLCSISAGIVFIQESIIACSNYSERRAGDIQIYHTLNTLVLDTLEQIPEISGSKLEGNLEAKLNGMDINDQILREKPMELPYTPIEVITYDPDELGIMDVDDIPKVMVPFKSIIDDIEKQQDVFLSKGDFAIERSHKNNWSKMSKYALMGMIGSAFGVLACLLLPIIVGWIGKLRISINSIMLKMRLLIGVAPGMIAAGFVTPVEGSEIPFIKQPGNLLGKELEIYLKIVGIQMGIIMGIYVIHLGYKGLKLMFSHKKYMNSIPRNEWWGYINWGDQTDIYMMITAQSQVVPALECYLGTILGHIYKLHSEGGISGKTLEFYQSFCYDRIVFHWEEFEMMLGEETLALPKEIKFRGLKRILARYLFKQEALGFRIVMKYKNKLVLTDMGESNGIADWVNMVKRERNMDLYSIIEGGKNVPVNMENPIYTEIPEMEITPKYQLKRKRRMNSCLPSLPMEKINEEA